MRTPEIQRRRLAAVACTHAVQAGCPHAASRHANTAVRSRWLRSTCAFACRCHARFGAGLAFAGFVGIAGFCAAVLCFRAGILSEAQYLTGVAASLSLFVASFLIAHFGDPHAWQRSQCQRGSASPQAGPDAADVLALSVTRTVARSLSRAAKPAISRPNRPVPSN